MWVALAGLKCLAEASGLCTAPWVPPCLGKQLLSRPQGPRLTSIWNLSALNCFKFSMHPDESLSGRKQRFTSSHYIRLPQVLGSHGRL